MVMRKGRQVVVGRLTDLYRFFLLIQTPRNKVPTDGQNAEVCRLVCFSPSTFLIPIVNFDSQRSMIS